MNEVLVNFFIHPRLAATRTCYVGEGQQCGVNYFCSRDTNYLIPHHELPYIDRKCTMSKVGGEK